MCILLTVAEFSCSLASAAYLTNKNINYKCNRNFNVAQMQNRQAKSCGLDFFSAALPCSRWWRRLTLAQWWRRRGCWAWSSAQSSSWRWCLCTASWIWCRGWSLSTRGQGVLDTWKRWDVCRLGFQCLTCQCKHKSTHNPWRFLSCRICHTCIIR